MLIKKINALFELTNLTEKNILDIEIGLTYIIESMCKNLQIGDKIFNQTNICIILNLLKS